MSNPVSNAEVEDVLASIRRLVSEDNRPSRSVSQSQDMPEEPIEKSEDSGMPDSGGGKLLLTESQRITPAPGDDPTDDGFPPEDELADLRAPYVLREEAEIDAEWESHERQETPTLSFAEPAPLAFGSTVVEDRGDTPMDEVEPEAGLEETADLLEEPSAEFIRHPQDIEVPESDGTAEILQLDAGLRLNPSTSGSGDVSEGHIEAELSEPDPAKASDLLTSQDAEPELPEPEDEILDAELAEPADEVDSEELADVSNTDNAEPTVSSAAPEEERLENRAARQMKLGAKIAALEAVIGRRDDQWEPDGLSEEDAYSGTQSPAMEWADDTETVEDSTPETTETANIDEFHHADLEADNAASADQTVEEVIVDAVQEQVETVFQHTPEPTEEPVTAAASVNTDVLDVVTLRDMVTDIVREELQGPLGERITRNVRKLVRREIQRALASQDFE